MNTQAAPLAVLAALVVAGGGALLSARLRIGLERSVFVALARALVQLAAVALVIEIVFGGLGWTGLFLVVMLAAASGTAAHRLRPLPRALPIALASIAVPSALSLLPVFATPAFPLEPRYVLPLTGIVLGNAMVVTSLAGRRLREELVARFGEIEARLALGFHPREAIATLRQEAVSTALMPIVDQTKNVGLVTLPGAFVGMLLGGATPLEAAVVQFVVLAVLIGAGMGAALMVGWLVRRLVETPDGRVLLPDTLRRAGDNGGSRAARRPR